MAEYTVQHERVHYDPFARVLKVVKGRKILAEAKYTLNVVVRLSGRPDREFVRQFGRSPAMELLLHVAHHSEKNADGTVRLNYGAHLTEAAKQMIRRCEKTGILHNIPEQDAVVVKKIETKLPPVELRR